MDNHKTPTCRARPNTDADEANVSAPRKRRRVGADATNPRRDRAGRRSALGVPGTIRRAATAAPRARRVCATVPRAGRASTLARGDSRSELCQRIPSSPTRPSHSTPFFFPPVFHKHVVVCRSGPDRCRSAAPCATFPLAFAGGGALFHSRVRRNPAPRPLHDHVGTTPDLHGRGPGVGAPARPPSSCGSLSRSVFLDPR